MIELALYGYFAAEFQYHFLDIGQTQAKALDIVKIACRHAEEFVKHFLLVVFRYAYAVVGNCYFETLAADVARADGKMQLFVFAAIFHGIVQQIENYIGKVHLVNLDQCVHGVKISLKLAAVFLHLKLKCVYNIVNHRIGINLLHLERGFAVFKHRHLKQLLHLEAQTLGLIGNYR